MFKYDGIKIFVSSSKLTTEDLYNINFDAGKINVIIIDNEKITSYYDLNADTIIGKNRLITKTKEIKTQGCWTFSYNNGNINNIRSLD